jgi:hypothetical protein
VSYIPEDDKARKMLPIWKFVTGYFPKAIREMTRVSVANNVRYNPEREPADINWARGKSPDQTGSAVRHLLEAAIDGKVFEFTSPEVAKATGITKVYVLAEAMWRIGAELEKTIEAEEAKKVEGGRMIKTTEASRGRALTPAEPAYGWIIGKKDYYYQGGPVANPQGAQVSSIPTAHSEGCLCDMCTVDNLEVGD